MFVANVLEALTEPFSAKYYHINVVSFIVIWLVVVVVGIVYGIDFDFQSVKGLDGITVSLKDPQYMVFFLL